LPGFTSPLFIGNHFIFLEETDSTNTWLRLRSQKEKLPEGTAIAAGFQTAGRGQMGNVWQSRPGENILLSILLYPNFLRAAEQFILSQAIALGVYDLLNSLLPAGSDLRLKWPNDVLVSGKKICGILIENTLEGERLKSSIAGMGVNVNQEFREDAPATSLKMLCGKDFDLTEVRQSLFRFLEVRYLQLIRGAHEDLRRDYKAALYRSGQIALYRSSISNEEFRAQIKDIELDGTLVLLGEDGIERKFRFKEVSFL
jgi:BirA family biotin operon repressor/biotin-[acetyl-CoA-carboxylase] ligase